MTLPSEPKPQPTRVQATAEWLLVLGLAAMQAWTTLCLGGYLATTMVVTAWAVLGLTALGGLLWLFRPPATFNRAALLPVPFLLYALVSVGWLAPAKWLAWREWLLWLQMWLVFVLVLHFGRSRRQTWVLVGTLAGLGVAGAAMAAWQRFGDSGWIMLGRRQADQFVGRSAGMFGIPNSLAGLLELMIPVCLALVFTRATRVVVKAASLWLAALFLFAVVLTGSRGGWIGLGLALMLWPLLGGRGWGKRLAGTLAVLVLLGAGLAALYRFSGYAQERMQPFLEGKVEPSRPIIWRAALEIWQDHPVWGGGAAAYNVLFDQYRPPGFLNEPDWTHNDYLNTLSDYGGLGFVLWAAAGGALLWCGWLAVRAARRAPVSGLGLFGLGAWRLGLFVGLLAFGFHLGVDFHTKLPALAFAAALVMALLLRDGPGLTATLPPAGARLIGVIVGAGALVIAGGVAAPAYRAEAQRYDARRALDHNAQGVGAPLAEILPGVLMHFKRAVQLNPTNGQAWADLSYGLTLTYHVGSTQLRDVGRRAELAADRALALCAVNAEFWVRKGVAMDMQSRQYEAEKHFLRALELAPRNAAWWYYYAHHLQGFPNRKAELKQALDTCLALDQGNVAAVRLRQRLDSIR